MTDTPEPTFHLFVYGTLRNASVFRAVLGWRLVSAADAQDDNDCLVAVDAVLDGYKKISPDSTYEYAVPDQGHRIRGYLVRDIPRRALPALKTYEGDNYLRRTLKVQTSEGLERAYVFVGNEKQLEHAFGHAFRDPLKQEILLQQKIDRAIAEAEQAQLHTDDSITRRALSELSGATIRDIHRRHFEVGGISDYTIRHFLKDKPIRDFDRIRKAPAAQPFLPNYLRLVVRQVIFNQFEERIHTQFRYELDHLPLDQNVYQRVVSALIALRMLNRQYTVLDVIANDILGDLDSRHGRLVDYVRRSVAAADALYESQAAQTQLAFVQSHMGYGHTPLGAELEFSNLGHAVIGDPDGQVGQDRAYDGFLYFYDFALDMLGWKLGAHVDDHREKAPGKPRRGFFEVALGNLSIEANLSKPITRDPWVLNQLIHHTMRFYDVRPHSVHLSMQPRSQHRPNRNRTLPAGIMKCLFAIAGDPARNEQGGWTIRRLAGDEIIRTDPHPSMLFSDISKRYSRQPESYLPSGTEKDAGLYVQQFRFLRLSPELNYEPIIMALKGLQMKLRPGSFLTPKQFEYSRKHRRLFQELREWGQAPEPIDADDLERFLTEVHDGLMLERKGKPVHTAAYIAWSMSQLAESIRRFNRLLTDQDEAIQPPLSATSTGKT
jgi:gamma-glutamylcyclotransferase (GGCT)/AIG2-like uncharacterized protein YtfP